MLGPMRWFVILLMVSNREGGRVRGFGLGVG